ncbi:MAG: hypothetical protein R3B99_32540 [Polyangiales bacterium]
MRREASRRAHEVGACVGAAFGRLRVEGFGFDTNETTRLVAAELRLDATSRIHLRGPLALRVELGLSVGLGEVTVRFDDVGRTRTLFDRWPGVWLLVLGLEAGLALRSGVADEAHVVRSFATRRHLPTRKARTMRKRMLSLWLVLAAACG